ncbi:hypothetical protein Pmgp_02916 [Pelotomaculum propionicicum]|uniref:Uncharacterized protein n=1 Tax=Pelotomaculum propionicicum TaxID=258475 RepID=A0A4Y7RLY0_9FIRM|nr:hypothetical protein [Peptococcaceae bacterium]TEB09739.1 hypothetical protein Pmgp_02916 [Pelotomaculum propionicicum]
MVNRQIIEQIQMSNFEKLVCKDRPVIARSESDVAISQYKAGVRAGDCFA